MPPLPLRDALGFEHPVWNAPMGGGTAGPELAAAVSNAGGLGMLGIFALPPSRVDAEIARTRALTGRPFGAGVVLHGRHAPAQVEACLEARPALLPASAGADRAKNRPSTTTTGALGYSMRRNAAFMRRNPATATEAR